MAVDRIKSICAGLALVLASACAPVHEPGRENESILDLPLSYQTLQSQILGPKCTECHTAEGKAAEVLFEPYSTLISDLRRWSAPGAESKIIRALTRQDKHRMPPPTKSGPLTQDQIEFIVRWIDAGRPEF